MRHEGEGCFLHDLLKQKYKKVKSQLTLHGSPPCFYVLVQSSGAHVSLFIRLGQNILDMSLERAHGCRFCLIVCALHLFSLLFRILGYEKIMSIVLRRHLPLPGRVCTSEKLS